MRYTLRFLPQVEEDVFADYRWYEDKALGLGGEFLRMFYACVQGITRNPLLYSKVYYDFQRCLLRRFPYAVYYKISGSEVIVFGLFHCARDPGAIIAKLQER
ncbi:type II toxin-antitoxin system RelE/ParE family toxin [bacterium]|nr:type II toxin-antitoxin system RelE/ParE family toxin [FCB group bacterium]MBL7191309.1 type II toxin-antitoxin system RelE/ParE family toxin [bacterium]